MNPPVLDPDLKINMSLDEIIFLNRLENNSPFKKTLRSRPKDAVLPENEHSVPFPSSLGAGYIYVTKKSPLLKVQARRDIITAASNRVLNSDLLRKTKQIIPARYKLFKTDAGVERILVPVKTQKKKKRNKNGNMKNHFSSSNSSSNVPNGFQKFSCDKQQPPPLMSFNFVKAPNLKVSVEKEKQCESDDDIIILEDVKKNVREKKPNPLVIDLESQMDVDEPEYICSFKKATCKTTLHERFTSLSSLSHI